MTFLDMDAKFSNIVSKGQREGITIDDYNVLKQIERELLTALRRTYGNYDYLNNDFYAAVEEMYKKGMSGVLTYEDYLSFKEKTVGLDEKISSYFSSEVAGENEEILYGNVCSVIDEIDYNKLSTGLSSEQLKYIKEHAYLLPLAVANNTHPKIKMYGDNSYMFLCQFHVEHTPSMGVTDLKNLMHCFACHTNGNAIDYLMKYEDLSYSDAVQLASEIFMFDTGVKEAGFKELVAKYQDAILSEQYQELLHKGFDRLNSRGIKNIGNINVEDAYNYRFGMIERIRRGDVDPTFQCDGVKRLVYLNKKS